MEGFLLIRSNLGRHFDAKSWRMIKNPQAGAAPPDIRGVDVLSKR
jgi:hypothetical protein